MGLGDLDRIREYLSGCRMWEQEGDWRDAKTVLDQIMSARDRKCAALVDEIATLKERVAELERKLAAAEQGAAMVHGSEGEA